MVDQERKRELLRKFKPETLWEWCATCSKEVDPEGHPHSLSVEAYYLLLDKERQESFRNLEEDKKAAVRKELEAIFESRSVTFRIGTVGAEMVLDDIMGVLDPYLANVVVSGPVA